MVDTVNKLSKNQKHIYYHKPHTTRSETKKTSKTRVHRLATKQPKNRKNEILIIIFQIKNHKIENVGVDPVRNLALARFYCDF